MKIAKMILIGAILLCVALPTGSVAKDLPKFAFIATNPQGSLLVVSPFCW